MKNSNETRYQKPEKTIERMLRADSFSSPVFNHAKTALIKRFSEDMPSIRYVSRPQLKLGGLRFNPNNYTFISNFYFKRLVYFDIQTRKEKEIAFPKGSILRETLWSPDGRHLLVSVEKEHDQELWLVKIPSLQKSKIAKVSLNSVLGRTLEWVGNDQLLIGVRTPEQLKPMVVDKETPLGPVVHVSKGVVSQNRTFTDLVKTAQDEALLAKAIQQQLVLYEIKTRKLKKLAKPGMFGRVQSSPDQRFLLVDTFLTPFSKAVPISLYAKKTEVWSMAGKVVQRFKPVGPFENLPIEGVPVGPRNIQWIDSEPSTLLYVEAHDRGDWNVKVENRDELFTWVMSDKKKTKPTSLLKLKNRYAGFESFDEPNCYWVTDYERDRQWVTNFLLRAGVLREVFSLNANDSYNDPGDPVMIRNKFNRGVIALDRANDGDLKMFLKGAGATPEGERPFLRSYNLLNGETKELFRSQPGSYERFAAFLDRDFKKIVTSYESSTESPRFRNRETDTGQLRLLYADKNPYQLLSKVKKEVITYERADGVKLSGILYYPLNYDPSKKYPAILQAYPLEYTDASTAGQVRGSSDKFSVPYHEDMIYNALRGYFVLDEAQIPIIGHPETKNDTFVEQLVSSAKAAIDSLTDRGLIDPKRVGVVGHSYGAYMVANLLTHSTLFATGVAKSGAYNRTLTPFGFQGERRTLWKAKEIYLKMSPFLMADQVKAPMLLIHGMADNNMGTFPMQSERYFEALKGQGADVRLVLLPEESHGYAAIESVEHVLAEVFSWFDRHL